MSQLCSGTFTHMASLTESRLLIMIRVSYVQVGGCQIELECVKGSLNVEYR